MANHFSMSSLKRLDTCDWRLQEIDNRAITHAPYDYGIARGWDSAKTQDDLYAKGRTAPGKIVTDAKGGQSAHNLTWEGQPTSGANDIFLSYEGKYWWGDEDELARCRMIQVQRYRQGVAAGLGHRLKVMPTLADGTEDLGHSELA